MTVQPRARDRGRKYRCLTCGAQKVGPTGMVACPECGGRVQALYNGRRKLPAPAPAAADE